MQGTTHFKLPEVPTIARMLADLLVPPYTILTLTGTLGAGKTTLVQALLAHYGIEEPVVSPTFTYLQVYKKDGLTIYHFDLYRLSTVTDFVQAGFGEYLYQPGSIAIIEWPEIILPLIPHGVCHATITYTHEPTSRSLTWRLVP